MEYKLGTGEMLRALKAGEVDVIVALTEGIIGDIATGSDVRIIGTYVESPLRWAISTGPQSSVSSVSDLKGGSIGISRFTSGSHLMSCVLASQLGWAQSDLSYVVEGSFQHLRESVRAGRTAAFMWEHFMQKPFHDAQEIRRIGEIVTPWPCFLLASRQDSLADVTKRDAITRVLETIRESCAQFKDPAQAAAVVPEVARRFGLTETDAAEWYAGVTITGSRNVSASTIATTVSSLKDAGILTPENCPRDRTPDEFVDTDIVTVDTA